MQQSTPGKHFEVDVFGVLRRVLDCDIYTSETLDFHQKVDGEIRGIGPLKLNKRVQVQVTRRIDHYGKLDSYLASRNLDTDVVSLYVEAHAGPSIRETAEHIAWAAKETQTLASYGRLPIFGLRIDDDAAFFDPFERLNELRAERKSPERLAALKTGTVYRFEDNGFWIMDETFEAYFAHYIDAFESSLRRRLREAELQIPVRFLPVGPARATDVRYVPPQPRRARMR